MPTYYFVPIPELPRDVVDQSRAVQLIRYEVREGQEVKSGTPLATVETWWAVLQLEATGEGIVSKTFFDPTTSKTQIKIGSPIAIITCDPEHAPHERAPSTVRVVKIKQPKPLK